MERLKKVGSVRIKSAKEISYSRLSLGFEKLDRNVFDPEKAYDKVAAIGVKWIRLQSGWARTEKEKGIYDFAWLDCIVDNIINRGMNPWLCLCYGNALYTRTAENVFGAVGHAPVYTEEERLGWVNYVKAIVSRYKGKIEYYEVWNEPDWLWQDENGNKIVPHSNAVEYAKFASLTADAVHSIDDKAKVVGGAISRLYDFSYINEALATGLAEKIDAISIHGYVADDTLRSGYLKMFRALLDSYRPGIELIQGESGAQSRSDGAGALKGFSWNEEKQMKYLLRGLLHDLASDVKFTSYFSTLDMIEGLRGLLSDKKSYLDYGYFGVLRADFDENGFATGEYSPKKSYKALQVIATLFSEDCKPCSILARYVSIPSKRVNGNDCDDRTIVMHTFEKDNGSKAIVYWNAVPLLTQTYEGTLSFQTFGLDSDVKLIDLADGTVYEIPEEMKKDMGYGEIQLLNLPISDTPKALVFGNFIDGIDD